MVERLSTLLHDEAARLEIPPVPAEAILRHGRRDRRRRRLTEAVAAVAAVSVVVAGTATILRQHDGTDPAQQRFASAPAGDAYREYGAFAAGRTVYVGNHQVRFPEKVKALYYTSLGVLVRMGAHAYTDDSGPSHYTLVRPDGTTRDFALRMGDRVPGTDPDSPFIAYAEPRDRRHGSTWDLVVVDLDTGAEKARTTVHDAPFTWGGWEAPPVTTYGTRMWALVDRGWLEYDWTTGKTRMVYATAGAPLVAAHGRYAVYDNERRTEWLIDEFDSGRTIRTVSPRQEGLGVVLSPDGRFARLLDDYLSVDGKPPATAVRFVSLDSGEVTTLPGATAYGWTPDGDALSVDPAKDRLTVCDPATAHCEAIHLQIDDGAVKLGGLDYES